MVQKQNNRNLVYKIILLWKMAFFNLQASPHFFTSETCLPYPHQSWKLEEHSERAILIDKISKLGHQICQLKQRNDQLSATVSDLRVLLAYTGEESLSEEKEVAALNQELANKQQLLLERLNNTHQMGKHLFMCSLYWGQFVN